MRLHNHKRLRFTALYFKIAELNWGITPSKEPEAIIRHRAWQVSFENPHAVHRQHRPLPSHLNLHSVWSSRPKILLTTLRSNALPTSVREVLIEDVGIPIAPDPSGEVCSGGRAMAKHNAPNRLLSRKDDSHPRNSAAERAGRDRDAERREGILLRPEID